MRHASISRLQCTASVNRPLTFFGTAATRRNVGKNEDENRNVRIASALSRAFSVRTKLESDRTFEDSSKKGDRLNSPILNSIRDISPVKDNPYQRKTIRRHVSSAPCPWIVQVCPFPRRRSLDFPFPRCIFDLRWNSDTYRISDIGRRRCVLRRGEKRPNGNPGKRQNRVASRAHIPPVSLWQRKIREKLVRRGSLSRFPGRVAAL